MIVSFRHGRRDLPLRHLPPSWLPRGDGPQQGHAIPDLPPSRQRTLGHHGTTRWTPNQRFSPQPLRISIHGISTPRPPLHTRSRCIPDFVLHASQPRQNGRYSRVPSQGGGSGTHNVFSPEYDDPANCAPEEDQYGSQYGQYGAPYDHYGSRGSVGRRSVGSARNIPVSGSPEPPPPPPRNHDQNNSSFNDSKESNEISEAECDRDQLVNRNYGGQYETPVFESGGSLERNESNLSLLWKGARERERRRDLTFRGYVSPSGFPARVLVLSLRSRKYIGMPDESRRRTTRPGFCVSL